MTTIIRYSNRKMYDPAISRYVSMLELASDLGNFWIKDYTTGKDITQTTLYAAVALPDLQPEVRQGLLKYLLHNEA